MSSTSIASFGTPKEGMGSDPCDIERYTALTRTIHFLSASVNISLNRLVSAIAFIEKKVPARKIANLRFFITHSLLTI
jgi:hypothetical protein